MSVHWPWIWLAGFLFFEGVVKRRMRARINRHPRWYLVALLLAAAWPLFILFLLVEAQMKRGR